MSALNHDRYLAELYAGFSCRDRSGGRWTARMLTNVYVDRTSQQASIS